MNNIWSPTSQPLDFASLIFKMGRKISLLVIFLGKSSRIKLMVMYSVHVVVRDIGARGPRPEGILHFCASSVAHQAALSVEFPRQEYQSGLPRSPPKALPNPGMEPASLASPALAGAFFTTSVTHLLTAYCILGTGNRKEAETASDPALLLFVSESGGYYSL